MNWLSPKKVLVPIDFSEASFEAMKQTVEFVSHQTEIDVLHVLQSLNPGEPGVKWHTVDDHTREESVTQVFWEKWESQRQRLKFKVLFGDPSAKILDYALQENIELIVIPSHGYKGLKRFLLGSVAEKIVRFSSCPVLVLRRRS